MGKLGDRHALHRTLHAAGATSAVYRSIHLPAYLYLSVLSGATIWLLTSTYLSIRRTWRRHTSHCCMRAVVTHLVRGGVRGGMRVGDEGWSEGWGAGIKARAKGTARLGFRLGVRVRVGVLGGWA